MSMLTKSASIKPRTEVFKLAMVGRKMSTMRKTVGLLGLGLSLALAASRPAVAQDCGFVSPPGWEKARIVWFGLCVDGRAEGAGVLRAYTGGKPGNAFFGRMAHGVMASGVMETDGGFAAGRFENGKAIETDDRQTLIDAFRTGAEAARAASALFMQQKNPSSAKFYADKAEQLSRQMD